MTSIEIAAGNDRRAALELMLQDFDVAARTGRSLKHSPPAHAARSLSTGCWSRTTAAGR